MINDSLETILYNKTNITKKDISSFENKNRSQNDSNNKTRESIIGAIINNKVPDGFYQCDKWKNLKDKVDTYLISLAKLNNINKINQVECIHKAGRGFHFDFKIIINKSFDYNIEFKFNAKSINQTPQYVSPMRPSKYLDTNYEEFYYNNYLPQLINKENFKIPTKEEYLLKIHSPKPECMLETQIKYYQGCIKSSKYTENLDDINFYQKANELSKRSISSFIENYGLKKDILSRYLLESQKNKHYMLFKDNDIYYETINPDNYVITNYKKDPKKYRYIAETKSGIQMKILLRWKNGNGIAYPAFQIS